MLFEPKTHISDTLTYDITAWSLPYIYGLEAFATETVLEINIKDQEDLDQKNFELQKDPYGYLVEWGTINGLRFLADILKNNITVRVAEKPFTNNEIEFRPGTLFISPRGNEHLGSKMHTIIQNAALAHQPDIYSISSGASSKGIDLGSSNFNVIKKPRIGVLAGEGTSSNNFGEIWHFFEQQIDFPLSVFNTSDFRSIPFEELDVLIMPNGSYGFKKQRPFQAHR